MSASTVATALPGHDPAAAGLPGPTDRIRRLRRRIVDAPRQLCVERARYLTRAMDAHWDEPALTRISKAFAHVLDHVTVTIREDELVVGCRTSHLKGAPLFPEGKSRWIETDLDTFDTRTLQPVAITEADRRELAEEILPRWRGRTVEELFEQRVPDDVAIDMDRYVFTMVLEITYGIGHFTMDHGRVLARGFSGLASDTRARLAGLTDAERAGEPGQLCEAMIRSLEAGVRFSRRHADLADRQAAAERDPRRAAELRQIAVTCRHVPEHPARTFREAVQCVWLVHLLAQIESGGNSVSLGRIDQTLARFYDADVAAGRLGPEEARELLACLYLKTNEVWNILEEAFIPGGEGVEGKTTQNVTVGGLGRNGRDATCALSFVALDAFADVHTVQPNFGVRLAPIGSPGSPAPPASTPTPPTGPTSQPGELLARAVRYARDGVALHLFHDAPIVAALARAGHSLEDARDYGVVGCLEPNALGKSFCSTFAVQVSGIKCLELALADGVDGVFGTPVGPATGDPADMATFEDVFTAYDAQMRHFLAQMVRGMEVLDRTIAELLPSPFASALVDGPLERGRDLTRGGALYNSTGVQLIGFANVVDSLMAIRRAVFEEQRLSLEDLAEHLASDWDDGEAIRRHLVERIPKWGNDDDEVDALAGRVLSHFCAAVAEHTNFRGGRFWPGVFSVGFHVAMGAFAGASADGRHAGDVLGNGITPANGRAVGGPTAVLNSVSKLPLVEATNGTNLNMRFNPHRLRTENLERLIEGYFGRGGAQIQFNMIDAETLRAARERPHEHRDLVVRVSGYSALFAGMSDAAQQEIIERTEYEA